MHQKQEIEKSSFRSSCVEISISPKKKKKKRLNKCFFSAPLYLLLAARPLASLVSDFFFRSTFFGKGQKARSPFSASVYSPPPRSLRFPNGRTCFSGVIKRRCLRRPPPPSSTLPIKGTKKKKKIATRKPSS